jgi:thiosulfate reductase cytochrome b subunit
VAVLGVVGVLVSRWFLLSTQAGADFLAAYPGHVELPHWAPVGLPAWIGWQHALNIFFMAMLARAGWMFRYQTRSCGNWRRRKPRPTSVTISIELFTHLALDLLWIVNGVVFVVLLFTTGQWARLVPTSWEVFPNALSAGLQYLSLEWSPDNGWVNYNSLQLIIYFLVVFVAAPLAAITGFRTSPLWPKHPRLARLFPIEAARAIHFPVLVFYIGFVIVHVGLVLATGALDNLNHIFWAADESSWWGFGMFVLVASLTVGACLALRPAVMKRLASLCGKVLR